MGAEAVGILRRLFEKKPAEPDAPNEVQAWLQRQATLDLVAALRELLVQGYEKDPLIRGRGPLTGDGSNLPLFCAIVEAILADLVSSHRVWKNHEGEVLGACSAVLHEWALAHGCCREILIQKAAAIRDAIPLVKAWSHCNPSDMEAAVQATSQLGEWAARHPELEDETGRMILCFCEEGLITTFLENPERLYVKLDSHCLFASSGEQHEHRLQGDVQ